MTDWMGGDGTSERPYYIQPPLTEDADLIARVGDWVTFYFGYRASSRPSTETQWAYSRSNTSYNMIPVVPGVTFTSRPNGYGYWGQGQALTPGDYTFYVWEFGIEPSRYQTPVHTVTLHVYGYPTIIYEAAGGTGAPEPQQQTISQIGGTVKMNLNSTVIPTKEGWLFGGWAVKGTVYPPGAEIDVGWNETVTATAYWFQNTAQITYDTGGARPMDPTQKKNAQTYGTVPITIRADIPSKQYFDFLHWVDQYGASHQPGDTVDVPFNGSFPLTAVYQKKTVTVHLVSERGQGNADYSAEQGEPFEVPPQSETGWVFKGWAETDGGQVKYPHIEGQILKIPIGEVDIYLFAVWNLKFNEEKILLPNGGEVYLKDVTFYRNDMRVVEVGLGDTDRYLSDIGYSGVQFVPLSLVEEYPLAFGVSPSDMVSPDNPDLTYSNVLENGVLTIRFNAQAGGYVRGQVKMAVIDVASMTGFILCAYLSQETDVTIYTVILSRSEDDENPLTYTDLMGSYRNPYVFYFPALDIGIDMVDKWVSVDTGYEYNVGESISLTGRYVTATQTLRYIAKTVRKETVLAFSPQGGRNAPSSLRQRSASDVTFQIPDTGIIKRGATFKGWSDRPDGNVVYKTNDTVTLRAGSTMTLYAVWEVSSTPFSAQGEVYLPYCGIMIYKENGAYFNATFYQTEGGEAILNKAENQPGSATFTLCNDFDDLTRSLCSDDFSQWSDGSKGAIVPGMYVRLLDIKSPVYADFMMDGRITTITPSEDKVAFEIGDGKAFLGKAGTWLRRNYRNTESTGDVTLDGVLIPNTSDMKVQIDIDGEAMVAYRIRSTPVDISLSRAGQTHIYNPFRGKFSDAVTSNIFRTIRRVEFDYSFDVMPGEYDPETLIYFDLSIGGRSFGTIAVVDATKGKGSGRITFNLNHMIFNSGDEVAIGYSMHGVAYGGATVRSATFILDSEEVVSISSSTYTDTADEQDIIDSTHRLRVVYVSGGTTIKQIMSDMAEALDYGIDFHRSVPLTELSIFRAGGSYALSYYQKLADQKEKDTFKTMSFDVNGDPPQILVGTRYSMSDDPKYLIKYGGDAVPEGAEGLEILKIHKFSPKITLKNRPNLVTMKANLKDNQTFTVSFEDMTSTALRGVTIEKLVSDSSASNVAGVGAAAFAELSSVELDKWEGEVIVPGIVRGLMSEGRDDHAGSGVPVLIQDRRFGMNSYKARVRQVTYDYSACVSRIILDNYDMMYSSGIASTNALAVEVGDLVGGIADTSLYNQQYVYVRSDERWVSSEDTTVELITTDDTSKEFKVPSKDVSVFILPSGHAVVACSFTTDAEHYLPLNKSYGVTGIKLKGGSELTIPIHKKREPDLFLGQTLSICVICKHGGN